MTPTTMHKMFFLLFLTIGLCGSASAQTMTQNLEHQWINGGDPSSGYLQGDELATVYGLACNNAGIAVPTTFWLRSTWLGQDGIPINGTSVPTFITVGAGGAADIVQIRGLENVNYGGSYTLLIEWGTGIDPNQGAIGGAAIVFYGSC